MAHGQVNAGVDFDTQPETSETKGFPNASGGRAVSGRGVRRRGIGRRIFYIVLGVAVVGFFAAAFSLGFADSAVQKITGLGEPEKSRGGISHTVARDTLRITVTDDGAVESANNVEVKCQVKGGSTILWIVEDGTIVEGPVTSRVDGEVTAVAKPDSEGVLVKVRDANGEVAEHRADFGERTMAVVETGQTVSAGDDLIAEKIVELDPAPIEDELNAQMITYQQARSAMIQARENYEAAKIAVEEYKNGTYVQNLQDLEASIKIAEENLRSAKNLLKHTERMARKGYVTPLQLESQKFAVQRSELELASARTAKDVLKNYTREKTLKELEATRDAAEATMKSQQASYELEQKKLERLQEQLDNCIMHAPKGGMVVYANEERRRSSDIQIEEGVQVRERQAVVRIPDRSNMQVNAAVHESKIEMIRPGLPAEITIRDRKFTGTVKSVANRPERTSWFSPDVKEYETIVMVNQKAGTENLKPGMSAEVEILVEELTDVIAVPVQAVVELEGEFFCWVQTPEGPEKRAVLLGRTNDKLIQIKDGLKEGERVLLNPRAQVEEAKEGGPATAPSGSGKKSKRGKGSSAQAGQGSGGNGGSGGSGGFSLSRLDGDGDGKISRDEAPEPMQQGFDRIDQDGDGFIDAQEFAALRKRIEKRRQQQDGSAENPDEATDGANTTDDGGA